MESTASVKKLLARILPKVTPLFPGFFISPVRCDMVEAVQESLRDWQLAKTQFNFVERDLIDYMVYRLNAAERRYMALLSMAKTQGLKAWPDNLAEPFRLQGHRE